jgi:gelsolin
MAAQAKLEDSNIALLGSQLEKDVRLAAAQTEEEWKGCGEKVGIEIWRVEKLGIKRWPEEQYGSFYSGDSYIILHTYKDPNNEDKILYNVHFWLGKDTSQDEAGVAAYKTVELDDLLGQLPVQFREVQDYESEEFLGLFNPPMTTMDGGIDSGFNKVEPEKYEPRLLQVKGKKNVRVTQVPFKMESLNQGDVFILDAGLEIYQWNGESSGIKEKRKGNEVILKIKDDRLGKPKSQILDGLEEHDRFWGMLPGEQGEIKTAAEGGDDEKVDQFTKKLMRITDAIGIDKVDIVEEASGSFTKSQLDSNDAFLVDTEETIYLWIGTGASNNERKNAFKIANQYIAQAERPFTIPVVRIVEGTSNNGFDAAFD